MAHHEHAAAHRTADETFDVVIVGARCAGAPLAAMLARRGVRVALVDQATFPRDTLSSHVIQADSLAFLDRLGVTAQIVATGAPFIRQIDTRFEDFHIVADLPRRPADTGGAVCVRRLILDPILAHAASEAGADVRMATKVTGLLYDDERVVGVRVFHEGCETTLRARLVVGADGRSSTVARLCGAREYNVVHSERWYYWTYFEGAALPPTPTFVLHRWGDWQVFGAPADSGLYIVGISPGHDERKQVRGDLPDSFVDQARRCAPVAAVLDGAHQVGRIFGITRFAGYFRDATGPGWVLTGDAGHFKDPAVGRGIGDAFLQAERLVPVILAGLDGPDTGLDSGLVRWGRWRDRTYADYYWLAAGLARRGAIPRLVPQVLRQLQARGRTQRFLELFSHRSHPSEMLRPLLVLKAVTALLSRPGVGNAAVLREFGTLITEEAHHRWLNWRPSYAAPAGPNSPIARIRPPHNGSLQPNTVEERVHGQG